MAIRTAGQGNLCYSEAKDSKLLNEGSGGRGWGLVRGLRSCGVGYYVDMIWSFVLFGGGGGSLTEGLGLR